MEFGSARYEKWAMERAKKGQQAPPTFADLLFKEAQVYATLAVAAAVTESKPYSPMGPQ